MSAGFSPPRMRDEAPFRIFEGNDYYEMEELVEPHERDHELGSDSFSHLRVPSQVKAEIESSIVHFSSWRGTSPGINSDRIDLACLRACCIDDRFDPRRSLQPLTEEAIRRNGWLIFCMHDMERRPSGWGCTPAGFEEIVRQVRVTRLEVASIEKVVTKRPTPS